MNDSQGGNDAERQPLSSSAACLAATLNATTHRRVEQATILAAFSQACPGTAGTTQGRPVLSALLDELADHHLIELPRSRDGWDTTQQPLPRWFRLPKTTEASPHARRHPSCGAASSPGRTPPH
ncbi:hypothetical protein ACFQ0Q_50695 [Streptomyces aureus]